MKYYHCISCTNVISEEQDPDVIQVPEEGPYNFNFFTCPDCLQQRAVPE